jgi:hypothetical protein
MDPVLLSLVSAATALVASIAGPFVSLTIARRQINANVLSANRQRWIESLREALAQFVAVFVGVLAIKSGWKGAWGSGLAPTAEDPKLVKKLERLVLLEWRIRLLLSPHDAAHRELWSTIEQVVLRIQEPGVDEPATRDAVERVTDLGHAILRHEWQRVKQGT